MAALHYKVNALSLTMQSSCTKGIGPAIIIYLGIMSHSQGHTVQKLLNTIMTADHDAVCRQLTPALESHIGLRDTCGVHNLHGMPGVLGGIVAAVVSWTSYGSNKGVMLAGHAQVHTSGCL